MKSGKIRACPGIADDIGALGTGRKISDSVPVAQGEVDSLSDKPSNDAVPFDTQNSDVLHWLCVYLDLQLTFKHHIVT